VQAPRGKHADHREKEYWQCQGEPDPELLGETADLVSLMIVAFIDRHLGFQGHSTDRAITRMILFDLRMHRTSIDSASALRWSPSGVALESHAALGAIAG
jgi:hypothetical protein